METTEGKFVENANEQLKDKQTYIGRKFYELPQEWTPWSNHQVSEFILQR